MKEVTSNVAEKTFTCVGKGHGAPAIPATREEWEKMRREPWLAEMCRRIEAGDEQLKHRLPVWTPSCALFKDNHRAKADALQPLPRLMLDFDEKGHSQEILQKALQLNEAGTWQVLLVEESVRRGTHVLITLPEGMTPQEAQERFSEAVGFKADPSLKDVSRCIYMVTEGHTLWVSEGLFSSEEFSLSEKSAQSVPKEPTRKFPTEYRGIPYAEILKGIAEELGGEPTEGERNAKVLRMASSLRHICDNNPEWLMEIIPTYGLPAEEWRKTIQNACKDGLKYGTTKVLEAAMKRMGNNSEFRVQNSEFNAPPPIPKKLPPLIGLLVKNVPEGMKEAVAHAVFPPLGAHLGGVKFRYIDNVEREATFMCVLLAKMSSGKSAVNKPIQLIMKDIMERDALNRLREQEWKASLSTKGANKEKPKRPEGLCIQMLVPDMTNAAFVQRLADADGKFLYTQMDELELLNNLKTSSRGNQVSQIIRLAFDQGLYGQERVGAASVTAMVPIRWNWNASATIERGRQFFRTALTDGTLSRLNFCTIPPRRMGEIPVYGTYDAEYEAALKPYIDRLNAASGLVECTKAEALARKLLQESAEVVMLTDDEVYEMLSHRANVIAYLKAMTLYIAHGYKWSREIEDFVRWSKEYDLWCKMHFFGKRMQEEVEKEVVRSTPGRMNMLEMLPNRFTRQQLEEVRIRLGKERDARFQLSKWKKRGYVVTDPTNADLYEKSEKFKANVDK